MLQGWRPGSRKLRALLAGLICSAGLLLGAAAGQAAETSCPNPDALNTSRTIAIDPAQKLRLGFKTYDHSLALQPHEVVLTFDDGPFPATTGPILKALAEECVRATFFLVGRNAKANPTFVRQELAAGHTIGHHSLTHPAITLAALGEAAARREVDEGMAADDKAAYGTATAEPRVPFFRFPGFADTPELDAWLAGRGITVFGADLWASDWVEMTPEATMDLLLRRLDQAGKGIILLHDTRPQTAKMLPALLRELKKRDYHVVQIVPGTGPTEVEAAPEGWTSETAATIKKLWPKLMAEKLRAARAAATPGKAAAPAAASMPESEPAVTHP